jgi:hypothetical protein
MTDYAATSVSSSEGTTVTERSGTTSSDKVEAGAMLLVRNTGAGTHVVTFTTANTAPGNLSVEDEQWSIAAGAVKAGRVREEWGDANGMVPVGIDGTASEVKFYVMGGV